MTVRTRVPWHIAVPAQRSWTGMFATTMTDTRSRTTRRPAEHNRSSPTVPAGSEQGGSGPSDDVTELREALRAADRGYRAYLTELRQGDVETAADWSTWYAEYLLGLH